MLETLIKFVTSFIMPIAGFFVIRNISKTREKLFCIRTLLSLFLLGIINFLIYKVEYQALITILNFGAMIICYKIVFKIDIFTSVIKSTLLMIILSLSEMLLYILIEPALFQWQSRNPGLSLLVINVIVGFTTFLVSKIKIFSKITSSLTRKIERSIKFQTVVTALLWVLVISILCYLIFKASANSYSFWICMVVEGVFIVFMLIYIFDKNRYNLLNDRFDSLYDYIQAMEDYLDNEQLNIHEYKNQLSVIRSMTSNKKITNYIDSILIESKAFSFEWNTSLKYLPKGGIKGLLYYKLAIAESKKLNITVNIDNNCINSFKQLTLNETKDLSRIIGVYLDNAIEASELTKAKILSIEIYPVFKELNFVICNSMEKEIDLSKINKKGFSSKGKNRGRGLYFANKIISKNSRFVSNSSVINSFFVQKIVVKQKHTSK